MKRTMKRAKPLLQMKQELQQLAEQKQEQNEQQQQQEQDKKNIEAQLPSQAQQRGVFPTLDENFGFLTSVLGTGIDLVQAKYKLAGGRLQLGVVYLDSVIDTRLVSSQIVEPLLQWKETMPAVGSDIITAIQTQLITIPKMSQSSEMHQVVESLMTGSTAVFAEGQAVALIIGSGMAENRAITQPENEVTISSAMDSFVEDLETNCSMLIRRLPTPDLQFESFTAGRLSRTKVKLIWIKGIANEVMVAEVRRRIAAVDIDAVEGIGMLAELIQDNPLSVFPTFKQTQRPDLTSKFLTEGRFAILCTASPFAISAPITFWDNLKTMDDYSEKPMAASYLRIVRMLAFLLAILIAPLYLAFVAYNHSIVPPALAADIAAGRQGVPFPSVVELLILTFSISIIREASVRISGSVGFFIGTLSAVVIGQASVTAGYVSASVIIVAAISSIASFAVSTAVLVYSARLINYFFILLTGLFGMFGLINGIVLVMWHLTCLQSFGVPYLYPFVPFSHEGMKDSFIRGPFRTIKKRLRLFAPFNRYRVGNKGENN